MFKCNPRGIALQWCMDAQRSKRPERVCHCATAKLCHSRTYLTPHGETHEQLLQLPLAQTRRKPPSNSADDLSQKILAVRVRATIRKREKEEAQASRRRYTRITQEAARSNTYGLQFTVEEQSGDRSPNRITARNTERNRTRAVNGSEKKSKIAKACCKWQRERSSHFSIFYGRQKLHI